ncbi:hypothetical protein [Amycolatopsis regifaucium]|uniref:Uncharacterized protein n=1 Tax=Amycolatopsis regifaucium TaxID=546365 RepID=A0A154MSN8_9PSEU|nr:hypothetical protein [Amycolatopsis regifaucium]KZB87272.1 hypothetical protein AVL48_21680 [Amycolatopsis regifaucium]OKA08106.1 hypothetical protein ATP06_0212440 [Amycolatopsis regifaucium]SFI39763.1 hypothetical protein SAMN04489731_110151 [Amycolatopsis regifaucium]
MNTLGVVPSVTRWNDGEARFLDWTIDGVALRELVPMQERTPLSLDDDRSREWAVENLSRLLGRLPGDFDDGRVALLFCPLCGDLGCGGYSVELVFGDDEVEWRAFGRQYDYEPFHPDQEVPFTGARFERKAYEKLLGDLLTDYRA